MRDQRECEDLKRREVEFQGLQEEEDRELEEMSGIYYARRLMRGCLRSMRAYCDSRKQQRVQSQTNPMLKTKIKSFIENLKGDIVERQASQKKGGADTDLDLELSKNKLRTMQVLSSSVPLARSEK